MRARIDKFLLLLRTVIWLKPVQIYGRVWFRLYRPKPRSFAGAKLNLPRDRWRSVARRPSMSAADTFTFLNQTETLATQDDWNAKRISKLWLYNAHYFDDLNANDAGERTDWHRDIIDRWIAQNPPGTGNGWEPYPTSLRIVNWAKWLMSSNATTQDMIDSLATQTDWLSRRLEHHLLGNHLFANAKALVFAGCVLDGPEAEGWFRMGLALVKRELREQILPDGGHFERSVMYHAILTEDVLDLVQLAKLFPRKISADDQSDWKHTATAMLEFLQAMTHPDGRLSFFNDGAFGIAAEPAHLLSHASHLGFQVPQDFPAVHRLESSGYTRLSKGDAVLLSDTAAIGPDFLPGHAHADTLSFEFSLARQRIFVNGGTSVYGGAPRQRHRERSTANHNTLTLGDQNSSEIWSDFRVARRAKVTDVLSGETPSVLWLEGTHDGFKRISGPMHKRRWELTDHSLTIQDSLSGSPPQAKPAKIRFRIHPDLAATISEISTETHRIAIDAHGGTLTLEDGIWSPEFGRTVACHILVLTMTETAASISFTWKS